MGAEEESEEPAITQCLSFSLRLGGSLSTPHGQHGSLNADTERPIRAPLPPIHILPTPYQFLASALHAPRGNRRGGASQRRHLFPKGHGVGAAQGGEGAGHRH